MSVANRVKRRVEGLQKFPRRGTVPEGWPPYVQCPKCLHVHPTEKFLVGGRMGRVAHMMHRWVACPTEGCAHIFSPNSEYLALQWALTEQGMTETIPSEAHNDAYTEQDGEHIRPLGLSFED